ncbi:MAG: hypothetical protein IPP90_08080 [Gemmatimonadaceae bacterium]|nr:hypothetical protein [Gemmatimonadaceae bacterium]
MRRQLWQLLQLGYALPKQLRHPVTTDAAHALIRAQLTNRAARFLAVSRQLIYDNPVSPYRGLLHWAGCEWPDLCQSVTTHGVEGSLQRLRDAGVYVALEEFKRLVPICRAGLTLEPAESDFDSPWTTGAAVEGVTSGSRSRPSRVMYSWPFIAEESAHELVLYAQHGVSDAPVALWYPAPPGVAGVHNLLMDLKRGRAPVKWFSQVDPARSAMSFGTRAALPAMRWGARLAGVTVPAPEFADLDHVDRVLDWMHGRCVLRTFASSAVRLAERARERNRDLTGAVIFTGGEPLTDRRRAVIESTGARVHPRYVATEAGLIGAGCVSRSEADDMHVYTDRIALLRSHDDLLLTTLSEHTGKVLFNTNLGDTGELSTRECPCAFGQLGLTTHLSQVRSQSRLTVEGMSVMGSDLDAALADAVRRVGGPPDSFQYRRASPPHQLDGIVIAVSARVEIADEGAFVNAVYDGLRARGPGQRLAADLWQQARVLRLVREEPQMTAGAKLLTQHSPERSTIV